jgi:hypothetical protein
MDRDETDYPQWTLSFNEQLAQQVRAVIVSSLTKLEQPSAPSVTGRTDSDGTLWKVLALVDSRSQASGDVGV